MSLNDTSTIIVQMLSTECDGFCPLLLETLFAKYASDLMLFAMIEYTEGHKIMEGFTGMTENIRCDECMQL